MGTKIKLTEGQIDRMMKRLVSEQKKQYGVTDNKAAGAYQQSSTQDYKATGSDLFKSGQDQIDTNHSKIIDLVLKLKDAALKSGGMNVTATVNGGASNTKWGNDPAGSTKAVTKNKELATKRRDNLIKYLKSQVPNVNFVPGYAVVGKVDSNNLENDQFVSINIDGKGVLSVSNVDRDNTSTQYNIYDKKNVTGGGGKPKPTPGVKMKRVAIKIPANLVDKYRLKVREFSKEQNLGDIPFGIYDVK